MHITGRCHCGQVTFEATIDPQKITICHCTDCQKLSGSPFRVSAITHRSDLFLTGAPPRVYRKVAENGRGRLQHFCSVCGSPLFTHGEGEDADIWGIRWGSIDQRQQLKPTRQIWCRSGVSWLNEVAGLPGEERG